MTEFLFFSGKGGVGKTSMACMTAVRHADEGKRTLIVTTDPASNLSDVFEQSIGHQITAITGIPNLWAMEIDGDRATEEYKSCACAAAPRFSTTDGAGDRRADERTLHGRSCCI
jgi:arsenite-transporting ATPase